MNKAEWYVDWFNSPYYHLLYNNRNYAEADYFINNLCNKLHLQKGAKLWDLACGNGRHAIALNNKGFDVCGTDLAENNIKQASLNANNSLHFFLHDMRQTFDEKDFDAVLNLFTSIGYFGNFNDNYLVFQNVAASLKTGGVFVIDFFNASKVLASFKTDYLEKREGVTFRIKKTVANQAIHKRIEFCVENKTLYFEETVSLLTKSVFEDFAAKAGLRLREVYGNYQLDAFDERQSERLILIFEK